MKGHATRCDIARGRSTELDKWGNDGADALAVAGAALHAVPVPAGILEAARQRTSTAKSKNTKCVQRMMLAVLKARLQAEQTQSGSPCDRGSELGDFDADCIASDSIASDCTACIDELEDEVDTGDITLSGAY